MVLEISEIMFGERPGDVPKAVSKRAISASGPLSTTGFPGFDL